MSRSARDRLTLFFFLPLPYFFLSVLLFHIHTLRQGPLYFNDPLTETHYLYYLWFIKAFLIKLDSK